MLLALAGGAGVLAYGLLWVFVPQQEVVEPGFDDSSASSSPDLSRGLVLSLAALGVGAVLVADLAGWRANGLWQLVVVGLGAALVWLRVDEEQRARLLAGVESRPSGWSGALQVAIGVMLVVAGIVAFVAGRGGLEQAAHVLTAAVVVTLGLVLLLSPYVLRVLRDRDAERRDRIRAQERAELAAQVHDSVLQTLTLVQRHAAEPREVVRLARAQERDLRRWLYAPPGTVDASFRAALERVAAEVEDSHGVPVEVVCVGDAALDASDPDGVDRWSGLLLAAREAMVNAAKHSGSTAPIAVYAEVGALEVVVYVRDRGPGFDPDTVPADRLGVRQSIIGRMERNGGTATVRSDSTGTEVRLALVPSTETSA